MAQVDHTTQPTTDDSIRSTGLTAPVPQPDPTIIQENAHPPPPSETSAKPDGLRSPAPSPSTITNPTPTSLAAPLPKRFSTVNVNKKFLQKNSASPATTPLPLATNATKTNVRPPPPTSSHSRLVTTKLTANPSPASTSNQGWSRPSSVTPTAPSPSGSAGASLPHAAVGSAAPQLPHVGKIIQPQPRPGSTIGPPKDSSKLVWGSRAQPNSLANRASSLLQEFPTAAEAAAETRLNESTSQHVDAPPSTSAAEQQARSAEADTFRGVHLNPNAHHWDDMEGDDDDFLNEVIEFGDGRQYTIETSTSLPETVVESEKPKAMTVSASENAIPVSKQERFADDFDRSWPRSRHSPPHPSGNDSSRALFNERSNKLEPIANAAHRLPTGARKDSDSESRPSISPRESLRVLSKDPDDKTRRSGEGRWREPSVRSGPSTRPSHHDQPIQERGRFTASSSSPSMAKEGRPLPPHLSQLPPAPRPRRMSSRESRVSSGMREPISPLNKHPPPHHSPTLSHVSATPLSPTVQTVSSPLLPAGNVDEARKDIMADAAARAKQRRVEEEKERERERERAHKKAAELEARFKPQEPPKAEPDPATTFIAEAIQGAREQQSAKVEPPQSPTAEPSRRRRDSIRENTRQNATEPHRPTSSRTVTAEAESWRTKAAPPPSTIRRDSTSNTSKAKPFLTNANSSLDLVTGNAPERLEEVDFSDLGGFVEGKETQQQPGTSKPNRPVAEDFFDEAPVKPNPWRRNNNVAESEKPTADAEGKPAQERPSFAGSKHHARSSSFGSSLVDAPTDAGAAESSRAATSRPPVRNPTFQKEPAMSAFDDALSRIKGALVGMQTTQDNTRDTPQSKVVDHRYDHRTRHPDGHGLPPRAGSYQGRWSAPSVRVVDHADEEAEVFATSCPEPPRSPPRRPTVGLPRAASRVASRQTPRQPAAVSLGWEILTWEPPVEGMDIRLLSLNSVLFPPPSPYRGRIKYRVQLPKRGFRGHRPFNPDGTSKYGTLGKHKADDASSWRKPVALPSASAAVAAPIVKLPNSSAVSEDTILPSIDDTVVTPGSPHSSTSKSRPQPKMPAGSSVAIRRDSRIDAVDANATSLVTFIVNSELEGSSPQIKDSVDPAKEDAKVDSHESPRFQAPSGSLPLDFEPLATSKVVPSMTLISGSSTLKSHASSPVSGAKPLKELHTEDLVPVTPSSRNTSATWTKSPLTFPIKVADPMSAVPEQVKAAWSSSSEKDHLPSVNSLKGIADDLTSLPFTLQDSKSDDGHSTGSLTAPAAPLRSSFDVVKAFQQVPSSFPVTSVQPSHPSPPNQKSAGAGNGQRPSANYGTPSTSTAPRSTGYAPLHSPMMGHAPAPYPHPSPMPGRMHHQPVYHTPPMWLPIPPPSSTPTPGGMMRPAPYPSPVMQFTPGPQPMYPQAPVHSPLANGAGMGRGRGNGMPGSPALAHQPHHQPSPVHMYPGNPMLQMMPMHVPGSPAMGGAIPYAPQSPMRPAPVPIGQRPPVHQQPSRVFTPLHSTWHP